MRRFFLSQPFTFYCLFLVVLVCVVSWVTTPHGHHPQDQKTVKTYLQHIRQISARPRVLGYSRARFGDGWGMQITDRGVCDTRDLLLVQTFGGSAGGCANDDGDGAAGERRGVDPYTHHPMDRHGVDKTTSFRWRPHGTWELMRGRKRSGGRLQTTCSEIWW